MVHFVGAGSGAPDLITVRGARLLGEADIVIYAGSLVNPALLDATKPGCEIHDSAKMTLEEVIAVIRQAEAEGKTTVRLHTGDSSIYGAVREQFDALEKLGIDYDVCPGVSAFCGAVSAGCGAAAGVAWLLEGTYEAVSATITNTLGMISGTVCDGAKPSCATKIASAVEAGLLGFDLYEKGKALHGGDGILKNDVERTIESVGQLAREGMRETDEEILDIMLDE